MRQVQVTVPKKFASEAEDVLKEFSSDISSSEVETDDEKSIQFSATIDDGEVDELSEHLKSIEDLKSGDLSIRVLDQETLIKKGQKTRGSSSTLSQEEVYSKAQGSASLSRSEWGLVGVSAAIAAYGLVLDNVIAVIGAMMLAPMLAPFVSGSLSLVVGDSRMMKDSILTGVKSIILAIGVSTLAVIPFPVSMNPTLELIVAPGVITVLLSVFVGAAAALSFSTGLRDQIAGVAVAIALVPPLAAIGIGIKMSSAAFVVRAAGVAFINILAVIVSGFVAFRLLGFSPSTYYKKKQAERIRYIVPVSLVLLAVLAVPAVYTSFQSFEDYTERQQIRETAENAYGDKLFDIRFQHDEAVIYHIGPKRQVKFDVEDYDVRSVALKTG